VKALVTGAGGFCGRHLVRYLDSRGISVATMGVSASAAPSHHRLDDVTDTAAMARILAQVRPDQIYHLAGIVHSADPGLYYKVNTQFAVALICALGEEGLADRPLLLVGTAAEYGDAAGDRLPIAETCCPHPYNHYGISKLAQTFEGLAAVRAGQKVVVARPFNIIGPGMPDHISVRSFAAQIAKIRSGAHPPVLKTGNLSPARDFIDVEIVVKAYAALLETPAAYGEIVNICSGVPTRMADIVATLVRLSGVEIEVKTDPLRYKPVDVALSYGDAGKLRRLTGIAADFDLETSLRSALEDAAP